jgi:hypothetical protein
MTTDDPDPIATAAARYKRDEAKAKQSRQGLTELVLEALRQPDAAPTDIARRAEWTPAYVRKLARDNGISADPSYKARTEKARARVLAEASTQTAAAAQRAPVSAAAPPDEAPQTVPAAEPEAPPPLPGVTEKQFRKVIALAQGRATPDQRQRMNRTAKVAEQLGRDKHEEVLKAAFEMGLLTHDEVYGERPDEEPTT